jgi:hypothetical protein
MPSDISIGQFGKLGYVFVGALKRMFNLLRCVYYMICLDQA